VRTAQRVEWIAVWSKRYFLAQALAAILLGVNLLQRLGQNRRMSFVADTLSGAWQELYHFFVVLVFVISTFSVLGPLLIGDQMEVFSQLQYIIEGAPDPLTVTLALGLANPKPDSCTPAVVGGCRRMDLVELHTQAAPQPMTQVEKRWPESTYFLLSREEQQASGVSL